MTADDEVLDQLTLAEKASLCLGADFWHTAAVERLGIPDVALSDGPHGLRVQPMEGDHVGVSGSLPTTCFPTVVLGPGVNIRRSPLCGRNFEYFSEDPLLSGRVGAALVHGIPSQGVGTSVNPTGSTPRWRSCGARCPTGT